MSNYRRYFVPGGTYFFTITTYRRKPLFAVERNVQLLRQSVAMIKNEQPFVINAAVVLPDHLHFLWSLPPGDDQYSKRIGRIKVEFTKALRGSQYLPGNVTISRRKHRERDVWQRRFWEHTIRDETDFERHFDYIHYNAVKHGLTTCPHRCTATSFHYWVAKNVLDVRWGCNCTGRYYPPIDFSDIEGTVGE